MAGGRQEQDTEQAAGIVLEIAQRLAAELRPGRTVAATLDSLLDRELGFDSLARVELLARLDKGTMVDREN